MIIKTQPIIIAEVHPVLWAMYEKLLTHPDFQTMSQRKLFVFLWKTSTLGFSERKKNDQIISAAN